MSVEERLRPVVYVVVLTSLALALVSWVSLVVDVWTVSARLGLSPVEGLHLDQPAWQEWFAHSLLRLINPFQLFDLLYSWHLLLLAATTGGVAWLWFAIRKAGSLAPWRPTLLLTLPPLILGLGIVPWEIRSLFGVLAEAGLSDPSLEGAGVGEAFAPAAAGLVLSLLLLVLFVSVGLMHRSAPAPAGTE